MAHTPDNQHLPQQDGNDSTTALARSRSVDSEVLSSRNSVALSASPLTDVSPEPAYIAATAASQIITTDHESFFQTLSDEGIVKQGPASIQLSTNGLRLVNQFLDYLLWSFLSAARTTSVKSIRPAVQEVLRNRLAREAIQGADAELREYLGDDEDEDMYGGETPSEDFDLTRAWRKTRLRCMVYSSLGDMEEDDEEAYSDEEYANDTADSINGSQAGRSTPITLSPAFAIFLTSVLEYIGEQTLLNAGNATVARFSQMRIAAATAVEEGKEPELLPVDRPTVEELDVEKVALNPILGRMWRQWRKAVRSPESVRAPSREAFRRGSYRNSRRTSTQSVQSMQSMRAIVDNEEAKLATTESQPELDTETEPEHVAPVTSTPTIVKELVTSEEPENNKHPIPPRISLPRLSAEERLLPYNIPLPLTPIIETPSIIDSDGRKRLTLTLGNEIAEDGGSPFLVPQTAADFRPNSMPYNVSNFSFPFIAEKPELMERSQTPSPDKPTFMRARSNSLPLPNELAFSKIDDFRAEYLAKKGQKSRAASKTSLVSPTDGETVYTTDIEYDTDGFSLHSPMSVESGLNRRPSTQFLEAQTITITTPMLLQVKDRKSMIEEEPTMEEKYDTVSSDVPDVADSSGSEEIGVATTSDKVVAPPTEQVNSDAKPIRRISVENLVKKKRSSTISIPTVITSHAELEQPTIPEARPSDEIPSTQELKEMMEPVTPSDDEQMTLKDEAVDTASPNNSAIEPAEKSLESVDATVESPESLQLQSSSLPARSIEKSNLEPRSYVRVIPRDKSTTMALPERAGVRAWTPPATPDLVRGKRSPSFGKSSGFHRPTASLSSQNSTKSKIKNKIIGRPPTSESYKQGSDNDSIHSEANSGKLDEKEKSFEELIQSGTTLQYTLTPESLVKMDMSGKKEIPRSSALELAGFLRDTAPPSAGPTGGLQRAASSGSKSRPVASIPIQIKAEPVANEAVSTTQTIPQTVTKVLKVETHISPPIPIPDKDVRRQNGDKHKSFDPAVLKTSQSPVLTTKGMNRSTMLPSPQENDRIEPVTSPNRIKHVAREASPVMRDDSTTALIDFFRNTPPPREGTESPAAIAPLRITKMQEDDGRSSVATRHDSLSSNPDATNKTMSYPSSFASNTELIQKSEPLRTEFGKNNKPKLATNATAENPPAVRKQSRVKDPYAIDSDDEDATPRVQKTQEESLMDFLKNVPPPSNAPKEPIPDKTMPRKNSAINLMTRLRTNEKSPTTETPPVPELGAFKTEVTKIQKMPPQIGFTASITESPINARRAPSRPLPVKAIPPGYIEPKPRTPLSKGYSSVFGSKKPLYEARGAKVKTESIDGLADFLRYSTPPPSIMEINLPPSPPHVKSPQPTESVSSKRSTWSKFSRRSRR